MYRVQLGAVLLFGFAGCSANSPIATPALPPTTITEGTFAPTRTIPIRVVVPTVETAISPAPNPRTGVGLTADSVLSAFHAAGLPIGEVTEFPAQPPRTPQNGDPGPYLTKVTWHDTRLPAPAHPVQIEVRDGGGVEVYADADTAQTHADNIQSNGSIFSSQVESDYLHGPVLVRLAHDLPTDALAAYKQVLAGLP